MQESDAEYVDYIPLRVYNGEDASPDVPTADAPDWLTKRGIAAWERLAPLVKPSPAELDEFACYCESIAEYQESTDWVRDLGMVIADMEGNSMANPAASIRDRADTKISRWASRFRR